MKNIGILCLLFILALTSCRKDINDVTVTENPFTPPVLEQWQPINIPVNGSVTGFVSNETGEPVIGATVTLENLTTTTDDFGHFFFTDVSMNARGTFVKVEKEGYFTGSRRFFAIADQKNRVKVELLTKSFQESFSAADGATIDVNGGASIDFAPNSIQYADGTPYSGTVRVAATWLDPSNPRTMDRMPGNLQGVNQESEEVALKTYGMMAVELESDSGEPLNILDGTTATLSMPVPAGLQSSAPAEIPLWSFNEEYGIWVEESKATLQGDQYVGEVSHFSFWNCDFPGPLVEFTVVLEDANGNPLYNYKVVITSSNGTGSGWTPSGYGYTCPSGELSGLIPANEELELEIYDICDEVVYTATIGPFSDDIDLGTLVVGSSALNTTTITGELVDCDGNTIANGMVRVTFSGQTVYEYVSGASFELSFSACANTTSIEVVGVDLDDLLQSDPQTTGTNGTFDLGDIEVCDQQLQDYISITVDGPGGTVTAVYTESFVELDSTTAGTFGTSFSYFGQQGNQILNFSVDGMAAGNYDNAHFINIFRDVSIELDLGQGQTFDYFVIDEYGDVNEPVTGTFGGTLTNFGVQPNETITITGEFNIIRDF